MGSKEIAYTIAVIIALFIVLLLIRGTFIRRARAMYTPQGRHPITSNQPTTLIIGGGWRDGGVGAMGSSVYRVPTDRPIVLPARPARVVIAAPSSPTMREVEVDELPRYEAPPPEYHAVVKPGNEEPERTVVAGEGGEASGAVAGAGPVVPEYQRGDAVVQIPPPAMEDARQEDDRQLATSSPNTRTSNSNRNSQIPLEIPISPASPETRNPPAREPGGGSRWSMRLDS